MANEGWLMGLMGSSPRAYGVNSVHRILLKNP
jgi:hypothetical protein